MSNSLKPPLTFANYLIGAIAGALMLGTLRFFVALGFWHWGDAAGEGAFFFAAISGVIGVGTGAFAAVWCKPLFGAFIGGAMSGGHCLMLGGYPALIGVQIMEHHGRDTYNFQVGFCAALLAMTIAGVFAGGVGAAVGRKWQCHGH